MRYFSFF